MEKTLQNMKDLEKELNDEVSKMVEAESQIANEAFNEKTKIKTTIMNRIWMVITEKLIKTFKIKITLYYKDKVVFEYEIPKN